MNPDKLFDYLDGKLPEHERRALEEELLDDAEARREFGVARRIHSATHGEREHLEILDGISEEPPRGRRIARQVLLATVVLVGMNVLLGLLYIAHHESKNPNRALLEKQNREQLRQALDKAAAGSLSPPPLGVAEMSVPAEPGRGAMVAEEIAQLAARLRGNATKGIPDNGRVEVLAEIAAKNAGKFRAALKNLGATSDTGADGVPSGANGEEKISFVVQVTEGK